ncbi:hypothetical protein F9L16_24075 [Agarivorans sp. B2Z047]|uniref:hypothetical protein n=1 Tax=Agarivorans sp. B2Z047 TaxID=2652721 RepID=UPI00128BCE2E|nr:hypothetical protein [Agarivorans sp. B2Z047]MPW32026.1 hypothetical protein [Agarivorans sp. B2Z047]UQN42331.1 hypothetical protein LQZ07_21550 [Agarivorans sp. B2Z047]
MINAVAIVKDGANTIVIVPDIDTANALAKRHKQSFIIEIPADADFIADGRWAPYRPDFEHLQIDPSLKNYFWIKTVESVHAEILNERLAALSIYTDSLYQPSQAKYSEAERQSWITQEREAEAWLGDSSISTPVIDLYCNDDKTRFCQKVLDKARKHKSSLFIVAASQRVRGALESFSLDDLYHADIQLMLQGELNA